MSSIYDIAVHDISGAEFTLDRYRGKLMLIVNVASRCGFTPQYAGLETLWKTYGERGLVVLGFPCNQFGAQEPGTENEIAQFCSVNFGVSFPLFAKIDVNGSQAHPLFEHLKAAAPGVLGSEMIKWNFTKFLVSGDGQHVTRYAPNTTPADLAADIEILLAA